MACKEGEKGKTHNAFVASIAALHLRTRMVIPMTLPVITALV
jgi:hypothetical protein